MTKALIVNGSLKYDSTDSTTLRLCKMVYTELEKFGVESTLIHMADWEISLGIARESEKPDQMDGIYELIESHDIIVFATPIWWGYPSSLIQKLIERMTAYDDEFLSTGKHALYGKLAGVIVSGSDDGVQTCMARIYLAAVELGLTIPPEAFCSYLGNPQNDPPEGNKLTHDMTRIMARNLAAWGQLHAKSNIGEKVQRVRRTRTA